MSYESDLLSPQGHPDRVIGKVPTPPCLGLLRCMLAVALLMPCCSYWCCLVEYTLFIVLTT